MQVILRIAIIDTTNVMTIAYDVCKDTLDLHLDVEERIVGGNFTSS